MMCQMDGLGKGILNLGGIISKMNDGYSPLNVETSQSYAYIMKQIKCLVENREV